jgi:hypothetical protein
LDIGAFRKSGDERSAVSYQLSAVSKMAVSGQLSAKWLPAYQPSALSYASMEAES